MTTAAPMIAIKPIPLNELAEVEKKLLDTVNKQ